MENTQPYPALHFSPDQNIAQLGVDTFFSSIEPFGIITSCKEIKGVRIVFFLEYNLELSSENSDKKSIVYGSIAYIINGVIPDIGIISHCKGYVLTIYYASLTKEQSNCFGFPECHVMKDLLSSGTILPTNSDSARFKVIFEQLILEAELRPWMYLEMTHALASELLLSLKRYITLKSE
jgi:hypothetical protein